MSTKHTPLRLETSPDGTVVKIVEANNQTIAAIDWGFDIAGAANMARLIVLAVNSHDDLVEALEAMVLAWESMPIPGLGKPGTAATQIDDMARRAIQKAKGKQ